MKYSVTYRNFLVAQSTQNVPNNGCSSCTFINTGSDAVLLDNSIPLAPGDEFEYSNLPNEVIEKPFSIVFLTAVAPKVLVIQKYTKLLK